jgi:hypothetical protein
MYYFLQVTFLDIRMNLLIIILQIILTFKLSFIAITMVLFEIETSPIRGRYAIDKRIYVCDGLIQLSN